MAFRLGLSSHFTALPQTWFLFFYLALPLEWLALNLHPGMAGSSYWGHGVQCSHPEERRGLEKVLVSAFSKRSYFGHVSVPGARKTQYTDWLSLGHPMHISR